MNQFARNRKVQFRKGETATHLKLWYGRRIMKTKNGISRRSFLGSMAAAPLAMAMAHSKLIPVGLELYSVRNELQKDLMGTVRSVA